MERQAKQLHLRLSTRRTSGPDGGIRPSLQEAATKIPLSSGKVATPLAVDSNQVRLGVNASLQANSSTKGTKGIKGRHVVGEGAKRLFVNVLPRSRPPSQPQFLQELISGTPNDKKRKGSTPPKSGDSKIGRKVARESPVSASKPKDLFDPRKPYNPSKRLMINNIVHSMIKKEMAPVAPKFTGKGKCTPLQSPRGQSALFSPEQNAKKKHLEVSSKTPNVPKSQTSTPTHSANIFSARKMSHGSERSQFNNKDSAEDTKGKISIRNISVSKVPGGSDSKPTEELKATQASTASTGEGSCCTGSFNIKFNDSIGQERERLINYNKLYYSKHKEIPETTLEYYKIVKVIGKGAFGKVALGIHKLSGKHVAIKTIDKEYLKDEYSKKKLLREIYILKKIKHVNVIRLLEVFETTHQVLIVMEYAGGGDLLHYVKSKKFLSEKEARPLFRQVVFGLAHIHSRNVLHRDIKLDNILLDEDGAVKICDFGVSRIIDKTKTINDQCGTPAYIAPEIITNEGYKGFYVDHWSLGVLLYTMLAGTVPFKAPNMKELHVLITKGKFSFPVWVSKDAQSLINGLLRMKPEERFSLPEVLSHPWLFQEGTESEDSSEEYNYYIVRNQEVPDDSGKEGAPSVNNMNIENLFFPSKPATKLNFKDYCYIANDFYTHHTDQEAVKAVEAFGYPRPAVLSALSRGDLNHATASYNLLELT